MDYSNFSDRLQKILKSMNGRFDDDIAVYVTHHQNGWSYNVGGDVDDVINKIFIILYNLSSLKDHLKNCIKKTGRNPQVIEDEVNTSLHLQVLLDLVNQEKHGYPLAKGSRSGKSPLIKMAMQTLRVSSAAEPNSVAAIQFDGDNLNIQGNAQMVISAGIVDEHINPLFMLDELVETFFEKFQNLAAKYNCM